jgi:hypothetical protein
MLGYNFRVAMESSHRMNIIWFLERIKNKNFRFSFYVKLVGGC